MSAKRCWRLGLQVTLSGGGVSEERRAVPAAGPAAGVPVLCLPQAPPAFLGTNFAEESASRRASLGEGAGNSPGAPFPGSCVAGCERLFFQLQQRALGWHGAVDPRLSPLGVRWGQQGWRAAATVWRCMGEGCRAAPTQRGRTGWGSHRGSRLFIHTSCM